MLLLTVFLFCRYQRRVEWATQLMQRQAQDESTVHRILEDYTKPLEHPSVKGNENIPLPNELNSEIVSKTEATMDEETLSVMNWGSGESDDTEDPSKQSGCLQAGSGHDPLTANGSDERVLAVTAAPPQVHCGEQDVLLPLGGTRDSSQRAGADDEYVLVEEVVCDGVSDREDPPNGEVSGRK